MTKAKQNKQYLNIRGGKNTLKSFGKPDDHLSFTAVHSYIPPAWYSGDFSALVCPKALPIPPQACESA